MSGRQKVVMTMAVAKDAMIACQGDLRIGKSIDDGEASQLAFRSFRSLDQRYLRSNNVVNGFTPRTVWLPP